MDALAGVMEEGLARAVGVSNYNALQMQRAHSALAKRGIPLSCNEVWYNLLKRHVERKGLPDLCKELGVKLIAFQPLMGGLLTGKYTPMNRPKGLRGVMYGRKYLSRMQPVIAVLRRLGERHGGKSPSQVALNWLICKGALPIPGAKNMRQVRENAGALGWRLSDDAVTLLDKVAENFSK